MRFLCALPLLLFAAPPARAGELVLLTRDGALHHGTQPGAGTPLGIGKPRAMAALSSGRLAVAHDGGLVIVVGKTSRVVPGKQSDLRALAAPGTRLCGLTQKGEVVEIDPATGKRKSLAGWPTATALFSDGDALLAVHDGVVEAVGAAPPASWKIEGKPIAEAATDGHLFIATREGPLRQLDRATGYQRDLGLGGWWGTLALAADGLHLWAVTQTGKLWQIDYARREKSALAMEGWEAVIAAAVLR